MLHNCKFSYVQNDTIPNQTLPWLHPNPTLVQFHSFQIGKKSVSNLPQIDMQTT